jgi:hypothetical protein
MAYSDFKLNQVISTFGLKVQEASGLFSSILEEDCRQVY